MFVTQVGQMLLHMGTGFYCVVSNNHRRGYANLASREGGPYADCGSSLIPRLFYNGLGTRLAWSEDS